MLSLQSINEADSPISQHFDNYFVPEIATNLTLCREVYRIRYKVYCLDLNYEPTKNFPDCMEIDDYDSHSIHCLIKHKPLNIYVACVRVILPNLKFPDLEFPIEKVCRDRMNIALDPMTRSQFCEVSRLAIIPEFRRRRGEQQSPVGLSENLEIIKDNSYFISEERRKYPFILPLSLYLAACSMVSVCGDLKALTLMEPRLMRHLRMSDFPSYQVGEIVDFHGQRAPFDIYYKEVIASLSPENRELFDNINRKIRDSVKLRLDSIIG